MDTMDTTGKEHTTLAQLFQENKTQLDQVLKILQNKLDLQYARQKELETEKERNKVLEKENKYLQGMLEDKEIELSGFIYDSKSSWSKKKVRSS